MVNVKGFVSSNFTKGFLTIFLPFFLIISLIYLVKISALTAKIQLTFFELLTLYGYSLPEIIFYTLPISFVAALTNTLLKLSQSNEFIALYALGLNANKVLRAILLLAVLFSLLLASISFLAMPLSKQHYRSFKKQKKSEAKLNIVAGKLGQKFGEYYIYVKEKKDGVLKDIVIYNRENKDNEQFFSSQTGKLKYTNNTTSMLLNDGYGYTYSKDKLQQAAYKTLEVYENIKKESYQFEDIVSYWGKARTDESRHKRVLFFISISLIPFLSIYIVAAFSMINPRYEKNRSFLIIFTTIFFFYFLASVLNRWGTNLSLLLSIVGLFGLGRWLFKVRVSKYF
jgi:lipopolysaccharide export system permease protein